MKKLLLSVCLLFLVRFINAQQQWVNFTNPNPQQALIQLVSSDNTDVEFEVEVCGMFQQDTIVNNISFQRITIPGGGRTNVAGEPEIPYIRQMIAVPECDSVALSVNVTNSTTMQNYKIYPAPALVEVTHPDSSVTLEEEFSYDTIAYSTNLYNPQVNAEIHSFGYFRDQKYAEIYIYPVQFNPATEEIYVNKEYEITLTFFNSFSTVNVNVGIFNNIATNIMLNYTSTGITASINDNMINNGTVQWIELVDTAEACSIVADYLIICSNPFFEPNNPDSEVLKIANHRATYNGFDVAILNADNIISDDLGFYYENYPGLLYKKEQRLRICIKRVYEGANAQNTYDGRLAYVLLIGDVDAGNSGMPTSKDNTYPGGGGYYPSDYYFSCVTKQSNLYDRTGDLFIGRFCVDNNQENGSKPPVVHAIACLTGHFDGDNDCLGEALTTYSDEKGFTTYLGACRTVGFNCSPYIISDPPSRFQELIPYTIFHDFSHITGEYILESKILNTVVPIQYKHAFNFFGDPALNVLAQGFEVSKNTVLPAITTISTEITVRDNAILSIPVNGELRFENNGKLIIEQGASFCINENALIQAVNGNSSIVVYGQLMMTFAENTIFEANTGALFVLDIMNENITGSFESATFENITLNCLADSLSFNSCTANNSYIEVYKKTINNQYYFNQCNHTNTSIKACIQDNSYYPYAGNIEILNCNYTNGSATSVIEINYFSNYLVAGTTVSYDQGDGISVYYSGKDPGSTHEISNCEVFFTGGVAEDVQGIKTHFSLADIENNYVHDNDVGLACMQKSTIRLLGDGLSLTEEETQRIKDNVSIQVYSTDGNSLPYEFEYNSIYNENANDFVVSMDNVVWAGYDIKNNYWGENFTPSADLDPPNAYSYLPVWEPSWAGQRDTDEAKAIFYSAKQDIFDSNYVEAKSKFKQLIENYSGSKYQNASVKEILLLTDIYDQDYTGLKAYLDTVPSLWENDYISDVTEYIMTWCDIRLENYPQVIAWFENRILNPISFSDSILSIMDLGQVYLLMQDTNMRWNGYTGELPQHIPNSLKCYEKNREYLIDLLCASEKITQVPDEPYVLSNSAFQQVFPNPVLDAYFTIDYFLSKNANVVINLHDVKGRLIRELLVNHQESGVYSKKFYTANLPSGLYYFTLEVDGNLMDYKKIVVIN